MKANDPTLKSWIEVPANSDFPIQNIPFGVAEPLRDTPRVASRIGDKVIDLKVLFELGYFSETLFALEDFDSEVLNGVMLYGKEGTRILRDRISDLFEASNNELQANAEHVALVLHDVAKVDMLMPVNVGDYTDFYSSEQHAYNVGCMFRDPDNALLPNWKHLPVGYHGRASSIVVSGTDMHRPKRTTKN